MQEAYIYMTVIIGMQEIHQDNFLLNQEHVAILQHIEQNSLTC